MLARESSLLGVLTIAAAQRLGGDRFLREEHNGVRHVRMTRINDIVLIDHPADATGPRSINAYLVEVQGFTAAVPIGEGKKCGGERNSRSTRSAYCTL